MNDGPENIMYNQQQIGTGNKITPYESYPSRLTTSLCWFLNLLPTIGVRKKHGFPLPNHLSLQNVHSPLLLKKLFTKKTNIMKIWKESLPSPSNRKYVEIIRNTSPQTPMISKIPLTSWEHILLEVGSFSKTTPTWEVMWLKLPAQSYCWWKESGKLTSWGKGSLSHYLYGFVHPRCCRISINTSSKHVVVWHE